MANGPTAHGAFGRRVATHDVPRRREAAPAPLQSQLIKTGPIAASPVGFVDDDPELAAWKRQRRWQPPWRQIAFTASLCFGVGSLVLPDTVNDRVQWLLYGLAAASFWAGWRRRITPAQLQVPVQASSRLADPVARSSGSSPV